MRKLKTGLQSILRFLDISESLDRVFTLVGIPIAGGTVSFLLGLFWDHPHYALLVGSAVFAVLSFGMFFALGVQQKLSVFRQLNVEGMACGVQLINGKQVANAAIILKNCSKRIVFYKITQIELVLNGKTTAGLPLISIVETTLPDGIKPIQAASLELPKDSPEIIGCLKFTSDYGYNPNKLEYRFIFETSLQGVASNGEPVPFNGVNVKNDHQRFYVDG
jgi:hypothetical protein